MTKKYQKNVTPQFPMEIKWDIEKAKESGIYTWFREIEQELDNGWVIAEGSKMLMLGGYSYLGLNRHPDINQAAIESIKTYGTGMSGSRFLAGTYSPHKKLEKKIASLHQKEDAMVLSSGYLANVSTISCLLGKNDYILSDKLNHASIIDGARYSSATLIRYRHNEPKSLEKHLQRLPKESRKLVITDAVFSMSGVVADLPSIIEVCKRYNAILMVDECHSMYVLGENGGGIVEYYDLNPDDIDIIMATLSKAIPASGGYIASNKKIIEYLRHESRGFIYSIALNTTAISTAIKALDIFEKSRHTLVSRLHYNTEVFKNALTQYGINTGHSQTSIVPIHVGEIFDAAIAAKKCQDAGLYIHAVVPPVVPMGKSILRASITANHQEKDLLMAAEKIYLIFKEMGLVRA